MSVVTFKANAVTGVNNSDITTSTDITLVGDFSVASNRNVFSAAGQLNQGDTRFFTISQAAYDELNSKLNQIAFGYYVIIEG